LQEKVHYDKMVSDTFRGLVLFWRPFRYLCHEYINFQIWLQCEYALKSVNFSGYYALSDVLFFACRFNKVLAK
jgi:hypothetical protein